MNSNMFQRNLGYLDLITQKKLGEMTVLFAGCGVGSAPAEALARLGILNFILVDGDIVEEHNLNRQSFDYEDIGQSKVMSLKKRILRINPLAKVEAINDLVDVKNVETLVTKADFIFDTIDFLDLEAIVSLHDAANKLNKPIVSLFTAGFGAVSIFVPGKYREKSWIRELFDLPMGDLSQSSYTQHFFKFFEKIGPNLNTEVQIAMNNVFQKMKDGIPCVVSGALSASALGTFILVKYTKNEALKSAPEFVYLDLASVESKLAFHLG